MRPPNLKNIWKQPASPVVRYSLPSIAILLAFLIQGALSAVLPKGHDFPFAFLYLIAVFAVAWFGGYVPGVIACLLTMVGIPLAATPGFRLAKLDLSRLGFLVGVSLLVSAVAYAQKRRREVLRQANDELDRRVKSRTEDLARSVEALEAEIAQHKKTEQKLQTQLERLNLLDQTTRAIAEHTAAAQSLSRNRSEAGVSMAPDEEVRAIAEDAMTRLKSLQGTEFDTAFAAAQLRVQAVTVAQYGAYSGNGKSGPLRRYATEALPKQEALLEFAKRLAGSR